MSDFTSLEPAIDPTNRISFLVDWELTMKCNLDCSYCPTGLYSGHDNSRPHPPVIECIKTIDFLFKYVDIYMRSKPQGTRYMILNVYGGESLHHPNILEILTEVRRIYQLNYQKNWHLTITTTTNAIISKRKLSNIIPMIDEFNVSYHPQNTDKQKTLFKSNVLDICIAAKRLKCIVMMHPQTDLFEDAQQFIAWCDRHHVQFLAKQVDWYTDSSKFDYTSDMINWFDDTYGRKTYNILHHQPLSVKGAANQKTNLSAVGRACCGGRTLCRNRSYRTRDFFVENKFPDWFCSVNEFFVYIKQTNGEIYTNKDCKMNFNGEVGPIGNLSDTTTLLEQLQTQITLQQRPIIQCKKSRCLCGLCAPKAKHRDTFDHIMEKYRA